MKESYKYTLKIWPHFFDDVKSGVKTFEIRKEEFTKYDIGDILELKSYNPGTDKYDGRTLVKEICYVLREPMFGIQHGYAILGLKDPDKSVLNSKK